MCIKSISKGMIEMLIDFQDAYVPSCNSGTRAWKVLLGRTKEIYDIDQAVSFDGTLDGLRASMKDNGVDLSVVLPIATKVGQFKTINEYAEKAKGNGVISFASLHPYDENVGIILNDIVSAGFIGIKLHPDYQNVYVDDERFISLVKGAHDRGLFVVIHSGEDLGYVGSA